MDSPVAQLVEHSKLNREVTGLFPSWGIRFFPPKRQQDCQRHLFATMDGYHNFTIRLHVNDEIQAIKLAVIHQLLAFGFAFAIRIHHGVPLFPSHFYFHVWNIKQGIQWLWLPCMECWQCSFIYEILNTEGTYTWLFWVMLVIFHVIAWNMSR